MDQPPRQLTGNPKNWWFGPFLGGIFRFHVSSQGSTQNGIFWKILKREIQFLKTPINFGHLFVNFRGCRWVVGILGTLWRRKTHIVHLQRSTNKNAKHISGYDSLSQSMLGFCLDLMPFCWGFWLWHTWRNHASRGPTGGCLGIHGPLPNHHGRFRPRNIRLVQQEFVPVWPGR